MKRVIIICFFCMLIGSQFPIIQGVTWADFFCIPLFLYILYYNKLWRKYSDIITKVSIVYSAIMLMSGFINGTMENTVYLNFTRIFVEGTIAYTALTIALKDLRNIQFVTHLFYLYTIIYLFLSAKTLNTSIAIESSYSSLDFQIGRNAMAVTNLLLIIGLSFFIFLTNKIIYKIALLAFPFLIFNIIFSASRFSVISLVFFSCFIVYWMRGSISKKNIIFLLIAISALPFIVNYLESQMDVGMMSYSSDLLMEKLEKNEDGGFAYRINELNINVIIKWLNNTPFYQWLLGDGISITHGVLSFTFCCTGIIGFIYYVVSHYRICLIYWRKSDVGKFLSLLVFIFFFNDIVTNSRFIIALNNYLYMGLLACMNAYEINNSRSIKIKF